jgi:hypothetical protein
VTLPSQIPPGPGEPASLLVSLLSASEEPRAQALTRLSAEYGPPEVVSEALPFDLSTYYQPEMGGPLSRRLALFARPMPMVRLAEIKRFCLELEEKFAEQGRRRVNLDPGMLSDGALVLATTKYKGHRLAIAPGLYAELTLWFHHGRFQALPWTYPDYAGPELIELMEQCRERHLWLLKQRGACS